MEIFTKSLKLNTFYYKCMCKLLQKELAGKDAYQEMYAQAQDPANLIGQGGYGQVTRFLFCSKYYAAKKVSLQCYTVDMYAVHKYILSRDVS